MSDNPCHGHKYHGKVNDKFFDYYENESLDYELIDLVKKNITLLIGAN